jgi:hypothetical protein
MTNSNPQLNGSHLRTYEKIFRHPVSHDLDWRDVRFLFDRLGHVSTEANGHVKATRNGHTHIFPRIQTNGIMGVDEIMELRHFLLRSETSAPETGEKEGHWLVVIDHHEARIFRSEMHGSVPRQILPHRPEDYFRHAHNSKDFSRGQEKPDANSFFEPVARALKGAGKILIIGSGKGTGSEMEQFDGWMTRHHPELARRIIGSLVADQHHLTEAQLLAKAREFYANVPPAAG